MTNIEQRATKLRESLSSIGYQSNRFDDETITTIIDGKLAYIDLKRNTIEIDGSVKRFKSLSKLFRFVASY